MEPKPPMRKSKLTRRSVLAAAFGAATLSTVRFTAGAQSLKEIVLAEPVHQIGYLPVYMGIDSGGFAKRGLDVKTIVASGGAHVSALISGQVWGNIGGPESNAMANARGNSDPLISICNMVNRSNNYMISRKGLITASMSNAQMTSLMKGKKFALSRFGGTPDVCGRWYLDKMGLDLTKDVTIINQADSSAAPLMVKQGAVDIAISSEPMLTYGQEMGAWDEPYFSFPSLGEYTYSVVSVKRSSIEKDPQTVQAFVDVLVEQLRLATSSRATVEAAARKEFPTLPAAGLKGALDRTYADKIWSADGFISRKGYELDMQIVSKSGEFNKTVAYGDVIDMQFVSRRLGGR
jgi:NitT/TauT family transport system substrate-binding protein